MDVIVVGFNPSDIIIESLLRLKACRDGVNRIILIDNGSKNKTNIMKCVGLVDMLFSFKEQVSLAAAWNMGMHLAKTPYVVISNDDILYTENWLPPLKEAFDADPELGVVQPFNTNGEKYGYEKQDGLIPIGKGQYTGCCFAVRKGIYGRLKDFDKMMWPDDWQDYSYFYEKFYPINYEDQDFYKRVKGAGYKALTHQGSYVHHVSGETMKQVADFQAIKEDGRRIFMGRWGDDEPQTHLDYKL